VVSALALLPDERLPEVMDRITLAGARAAGLGPSSDADALSETRSSGLVNALDEEAFGVREQVDAGRRPYDDYAAAFARARAANAALCAVRGDTTGAFYEAVHAFGADEFLRLLGGA
jgi:hypothetical protein